MPLQQWQVKDVHAHCYCASLVCTLFIRHVCATSFSSARTELKTRQNIELMTCALTWCGNIFVGCSVTPAFFPADHFLFWFFPLYQKNKTIWTWEVLIIPHIQYYSHRVKLVHGCRSMWLRSCIFLRLIPTDLTTFVAKDLSNRPIYVVWNTAKFI